MCTSTSTSYYPATRAEIVNFRADFRMEKKLASVLDFSKAMIVSKVSTVTLRSAFSPSFGRGPCHVTSYYCHVIIVMSLLLLLLLLLQQ